ncbi:MAG: hypothetical protein ABL931_07410 [Usitatibacteraceae bacterium]
MWPFDSFRKRNYDRKHKAALIVLLGAYMFERMSPDEKARVESEVDDNFNRTDTPAIAWRHAINVEAMAAYRAAAMDRLGVQPVLLNLSWSQLFEPWRRWRKVPEWPRKSYDSRVDDLMNEYRPLEQASIDAEQLLRRGAQGNATRER